MVCLVGVDGSDGSQVALRWASEFAATVGERLCVVQAWEYPSTAMLPGGPLMRDADEVDADVTAALRELVRKEFGAAADIDVLAGRGPADIALRHTAITRSLWVREASGQLPVDCSAR